MVNNPSLVEKKSKYARFQLEWRGNRIDFAKVEFREDGTFVFISSFHNDLETNPKMEIGDLKKIQDKFYHVKTRISGNSSSGMHISLHPREQVMLYGNNKKVDRREITWFPVNKPFNLLYSFSPPIDTCKTSRKKSEMFFQIPTDYKDSVAMKLDIYPHAPQVEVPYGVRWGYCPNYLVKASFALINQRTYAIIAWPIDNVLEL